MFLSPLSTIEKKKKVSVTLPVTLLKAKLSQLTLSYNEGIDHGHTSTAVKDKLRQLIEPHKQAAVAQSESNDVPAWQWQSL